MECKLYLVPIAGLLFGVALYFAGVIFSPLYFKSLSIGANSGKFKEPIPDVGVNSENMSRFTCSMCGVILGSSFLSRHR